MNDGDERPQLLILTTEIVAAFASGNTVAMSDLPSVIASVYAALSAVGAVKAEPVVEAPLPAVPIRKSIGHDYIVCLEDGRKLKMLKRHLASRYGMTPDDYRKRWGLPDDYPMVAPAYAALRSALATENGLGRRPAEAAPAPVAAASPTPVHRVGGRRKGTS